MRQSNHGSDRRGAAEAGFTMIEVLVAVFVLIVGMLAVVELLTGAIRTTAASNERVGATNLARELTETARGLDYDDLTPALLVTRLQARGLGSGAPWTIVRRGVAYTVTATACTYDDVADKLAASAPANVCTPQPAGATGDPNGDDFRRVSFQVDWSDRGGARSLHQTAMIVNPSGGLGPRITGVSPLEQTVTTNVSTAPTITITTTPAAAVHWHADDGASSGDASGGPTTWHVDWPIGTSGTGTEVLDGTYQIIAQAFDDRDIAGDSKIATVILERRRPYAPPSLAGGHDTRLNDWIDFDWALNSERDVKGYRVYWAGPDGVAGGGDDIQVCPDPSQTPSYTSKLATSCADMSPAGSGASAYYVVALDGTQQGDPRPLSVAAAGARPGAPTILPLTLNASGDPVLTWSAPSAGGASFYRIYRDGTSIGDRVGRASGTTWTDADANATAHVYRVTAVGSDFNESDPSASVSFP